MTTRTGTEALAYSVRTGAQLHKHADPVDGARDITLDEARQIAREDPGLVWCEAEPPRLSALDPVHVGRDAVQRLLEHVGRVAFKLSPIAVHLPRADAEALDGTDLAVTVATLTRYAQQGGAVGDWQDHEDAADAAQEVCTCLVSDALGTGGGLLDVLLGGDEASDDPLRLVITAAWGRISIARGDAVTGAQLGALAGLHPSRVRALRAAGEIPGWVSTGTGRGASQCPAAAAQQWLQARGVAGV